MTTRYIIAFSSFYKAAYAKDLLMEEGIKSTLGKVPVKYAKACSTGLYFTDTDVNSVLEILKNNNISNKGIFDV